MMRPKTMHRSAHASNQIYTRYTQTLATIAPGSPEMWPFNYHLLRLSARPENGLQIISMICDKVLRLK